MASRFGEASPLASPEQPKPVAAPPAPASAPPAAAVPVPTKRRGFRTLIVLVLVLGVCGGGGFAAHRFFIRPAKSPKSEPASAETAAAEASDDNAGAHAKKNEAPDEATRIGNLIQAGRYADALKICRKPASRRKDVLERIRYREALCCEALYEWKEAAEIYGELNEGGEFNVRSIAAQLGQARCWRRLHRDEEVRWLLSRLILASNDAAMQEKPFLGEVFYIRASLDLQEQPQWTPHPLDMKGVAGIRTPAGVERYLDWADHDAAHDHHDAEEPPAQTIELHRSKRSAEQHLVTVFQESVSVPQLLEALARKTGVVLYLTAEAESRLSGRILYVNVNRQPVADVLDALVEPHGVSWALTESTLELSLSAPTADEQKGRARQALRRALSAAPDHPAAAAVRLSLANFEFERGKFRDAAEGYQRLLQDAPHRPTALPAAYNLGLVAMQQSNFAAAGASFLQVIDRAPTDCWTALGWWWKARSHLDAGAFDSALVCLRKSLKFAGTSEVRPPVVLAICTAHLLKGDPVAAHETLRSERKALTTKPFRDTAAFLDSLARFRHGRSKQKKTRAEEEDLLHAILGMSEEPVVGPAGNYLLGQACRELNMETLVVSRCDRTLETLRGPLALRMTYELGEYHLALSQLSAARSKFLALAATDRGEWGNRARLQLADLAMRDGKADECLKFSREVLADGSGGAFRDSALKWMGTALARQGKHAQAAECFAGRIPAGATRE